MNTYYYSDSDNKPVGPLTLGELQQLAQQGVIQNDTNVIEHGGSIWTTWGKIRPSTSASRSAPSTEIDPVQKVRRVQTALTDRAKSETGIGFFSVLYGALLVLLELLILPYRILMRALRDLSAWGKAGTLPTGETDLPVLTYQVVVVRALVHLLVTLFCLLAAVIGLFAPFFDHNTSFATGIMESIAWLFGAFFLNLLVGAFYEIVGISIRLVNYVKKLADRA